MPTLFLTGSSGALGHAIRSSFLNSGWAVAGFSHSDDEFTAERYRFYACDATDEQSVEEAFLQAKSELGAPRSLVATVGGVRPWKPLVETTVEDFRALYELNLLSFFVSAKAAMEFMKTERTGTIISIGAEAALHPIQGRSGYAAAKAGVIALTQVIAQEGKALGVNANCIVPTIIDTPANRSWGSPEDIPKWTDPKEIAALCLHLSSEAGASINGSVIRMPNRM